LDALPRDHTRSFQAPVGIETLEDAMKLYKPKSKDKMNCFKVTFSCIVIAFFGECLWETPVQNDIWDQYIYTFMGITRAVLQNIFELEDIQTVINSVANRLNSSNFSPGLYVNFSHTLLKDQNFLKMVNPHLQQTFIDHVASLLERINQLSDYQKKCMLVFRKSHWSPEEIENFLDPAVNITSAERDLVDLYIDGNYFYIIKPPRS
jgi:hypothetical protein